MNYFRSNGIKVFWYLFLTANFNKLQLYIKTLHIAKHTKEFKYLGFIFTCHFSFSKYIQALNTKAKARIGLMFSRLPLSQLSVKRLAQLFNIYVIPIYLYGAALWMSKVARTKVDEMDAVWTRYLKRYLLIPLQSNNAITYHICGSIKLSNILIEKVKILGRT